MRDPALIRAGRFDTHIRIGWPTVPDLAGLLRTCARPDLQGDDFLPLASPLAGCSAADAASVIRDARRMARAQGRGLTLDDVAASVSARRPPLPRALRRRVCVHEAGHALAALLNGRAIDHIAIQPASGLRSGPGVGGSAALVPSPAAETWAAVRILLAGRTAELLLLGDASAGAASDLEGATRTLADALTIGGLGEQLRWQPVSGVLGYAQLPAELAAMIERQLRELTAEVRRQLAAVEPALRQLSERLERDGYLAGEQAPPFLNHTLPVEGGEGATHAS